MSSVQSYKDLHEGLRSADPAKLKERLNYAKSLCSLTKEETLRLRLEHVGRSCTLFFRESPLKMVQGQGQFMYDEAGNEFLDCINNVSHVGHGNARVAAAVARQLSLLNTNSRFLHENLSRYAQRLTALFPAHLSVCYLVNSGSEANDLAMRLARAHTRRKDIVCVDGAYHGNLSSTMAISPYKTDHLRDYKPAKWAHVAPLPCAYRGKFARTDDDDDNQDPTRVGRLYADETRKLIERVHASGRQVAAFFVESLISCGGQTPLPAGYLRRMQELLHENGSLLVCDEVQTGFGRCGAHMWAFEASGADVRPDIVTIGKPMGNGFPVAAVVTTRAIADSFFGIGTEYFNTFGGNPASCAAALAVLDELEERNLMRQAHEVGAHMLAKLRALQANSRVLGDVRGLGYFIGLELVKNLKSREPAPEYAHYLVERFRDERILMSTEGKLGNVLKFKPPMVFNMDDAQRFLSVFERALRELELQLSLSSSSGSGSSRPGARLSFSSEASSSSSSSSSSSAASVASSSRSSCSSSSWLESSSELEE